MTVELNDDNFMVFAIKHYSNPGCVGMSELEDDLKRFKYLKRLFNRYANTGEPNERLIINHLVLLYNVFGNATTQMLFYKTEEKHYSYLKTFLVFLNRIPIEEVYTKGLIPSKNINDIQLDEKLVKVLRKI